MSFVSTQLATAVNAATRSPVLRGYQRKMKEDIYACWQMGIKNVMAVLPTGAGKTVVFSSVVGEHSGESCSIAHRQELVSQISMALARNGVRHRIIAPLKIIKQICAQQQQELGITYYDPHAKAGVAGVDTLLRRAEDLAAWLKRVTLFIQDEAHHVLKRNKWGKACALFPIAVGLLVTATPVRADGAGLGAHSDGVVEHLLVGPSMRELIDWGYLTDYHIAVAPTHIDGLEESLSKTTGDYVLDRGKGKAAVRKSSIVGDVVKEYLRRAPGKLGVCFASDLDTASDIAAKFRAAGVHAEVVDGNTPSDVRKSLIDQFRAGIIRVLVNVDLFGEGFDLPAIEVVMMARRTKSFSLFAQQFGRALRLMITPELMRVWDTFTPEQRRAYIRASNKPVALIIDHVGNVMDPMLGLPDIRNVWSLDRAESKRGGNDNGAELLTTCTNITCSSPMPRYKMVCQVCGERREVGGGSRTSPEQVDGDLVLLDSETLTQMRADLAVALQPIELFRASLQAKHTPHIWAARHENLHYEKLQAAARVGDAMAWWAGERRAHERLEDSEIFRLFWLTFGVDWINARIGNTATLTDLAERIESKLTARSDLRTVTTSPTGATA